MNCVEELYASFNFISDLFDFIYLTKLKILDLEGNNIKEIESIKYLTNNTEMMSLNMISNPISKGKEYMKHINELIPSLKILDDNDLSLSISMKSKLEIQKNQENNLEEKLANENENEFIISNPRYDLEMIKLLKDLGISREKIDEETRNAEKMIQDELNEEDFLLSKIKSKEYQSVHNNRNLQIHSNSILISKPQTATSETDNSNPQKGERKIKLKFGNSGTIVNNAKTIDAGILLNQFSSNDQTFKRV